MWKTDGWPSHEQKSPIRFTEFPELRHVRSNSLYTSSILRFLFSGSSRKSIPGKQELSLQYISWDRRSGIQSPGSGVVVSEFDVATHQVGYCFCISSCYETKSMKRRLLKWSLSMTQLVLLWSRNFRRQNVLHMIWDSVGPRIFYSQSFKR